MLLDIKTIEIGYYAKQTPELVRNQFPILLLITLSFKGFSSVALIHPCGNNLFMSCSEDIISGGFL